MFSPQDVSHSNMQMGVAPDMQETGRQGRHTQESYSRQGRYARQTGTVGRQSSKASGHCKHRRNGKSYRWAGSVAKQARKEGGWTRLAEQAGKGNLRHSRQTPTLSFMDILSPTHLSTATGQNQTPSSYTPFVCTFSKLKTHNMIHSVFLYKQHTN